MTHIERMELEHAELNDKIIKLRDFVEKERIEPKFLDEKQKYLLEKQLMHMFAYREVLQNRIQYDSKK